MTGVELNALMPLLILATGSVLVLLAGALRPGWYLYSAAGATIAAALIWSTGAPSRALLPGISITPFSNYCSIFLYGLGLLALLLAYGHNRRRNIGGEEYPATLLLALTGMGATCAANNLLMLFLGLEAFTFAFYLLVAIQRDDGPGGEAGMKYLLNGTLSAALLAMGMALIYCASGTLSLAQLYSRATDQGAPPIYLAGTVLILLGLAFKLSLAPAHLWTPDVYQGAPAPVAALLSTASKAAAAVALVLLLPLLAGRLLHDTLWGLALLSLLCGNLAALLQTSIRRMLGWSSIGQMGYVALALTVPPSGGAAAGLFYLAAYAGAGLAAFGALAALAGSGAPDRLDDLAGLGYRRPLTAAALAAAMFSLAGIPPAIGFMAKLAVFSAAVRGGELALAGIALLTSLVAAFFYLRVVVTLYMKQPEGTGTNIPATSIPEAAALATTLAAILIPGVYPGPLLDLLMRTVIR